LALAASVAAAPAMVGARVAPGGNGDGVTAATGGGWILGPPASPEARAGVGSGHLARYRPQGGRPRRGFRRTPARCPSLLSRRWRIQNRRLPGRFPATAGRLRALRRRLVINRTRAPHFTEIRPTSPTSASVVGSDIVLLLVRDLRSSGSGCAGVSRGLHLVRRVAAFCKTGSLLPSRSICEAVL